jgi:hypothetical protein
MSTAGSLIPESSFHRTDISIKNLKDMHLQVLIRPGRFDTYGQNYVHYVLKFTKLSILFGIRNFILF